MTTQIVQKEVEVRVYVTLNIPADMVEDISLAALAEDLVGEFIKVKSGLYENLACGHIESIQSVTETEPKRMLSIEFEE